MFNLGYIGVSALSGEYYTKIGYVNGAIIGATQIIAYRGLDLPTPTAEIASLALAYFAGNYVAKQMSYPATNFATILHTLSVPIGGCILFGLGFVALSTTGIVSLFPAPLPKD